MDLTPKQKTIHWPTELSQEFGWPNEDINRLLQRLEKISKQHKQQAWEYDAIMQAFASCHGHSYIYFKLGHSIMFNKH